MADLAKVGIFKHRSEPSDVKPNIRVLKIMYVSK